MSKPFILVALLIGLTGQLFSSAGAVIGSVRVEANFIIDESELLRVLNIREGDAFDNELILIAMDNLRSYLSAQGRHYVQFDYPEIILGEDGSLMIGFVLNELVPSVVTRLHFTGMRYFSEDKLKEILQLSREPNIPLPDLVKLQHRILNVYLQRSYLFARISVDSLYVNETGLTAVIGIDEGKPFKPRNYIFRGNQVTRDNTLLAISGLNQQRTITPAVLRQAETNIMRKAYIRRCRIEPVNDHTLLIEIEEGNMTYIEGVMGISEQNEKTKLSGQVKIRFLNLWGTDRSIRLFWKQLPNQTGELELAYHESGSHRFPLAGDLTLFRSVRDSTWIRMLARAEIFLYQLHHRYGIELETESVQPGIRRPPLIEKSSNSKAGVFWHFNNLDYPVNPTKGIDLGIKYRWIWKDAPAGNSVRNALEVDARFYFPLSRRLVGVHQTHLRDFSDSDAENYELWAMGGYNSLRGFAEDSFQSWRLGWMNWELRYRVTPDSRVYLFFDNAAVALSKDHYKTDIMSVGLGLSMNSRLGVVTIEYGLGYQDKRFMDIGNGLIHLGLDTSF